LRLAAKPPEEDEMSMEKYCDLHAHSNVSDGSLTPTQLLRLAEQSGLSAVVLSDHNSVAGLPEFTEAARNSPVEAVPAVEFSTEYENIELHILALYVRPEHYDAINTLLEDFKRRKELSNLALIKALREAGYDLDYDTIRGNHGYVNRAHIAEAMTQKGYTASVQEAFKTLLSPKRGYYVPPKRPDVFETIRFIKSMGAVAVLAHPFLNLDEVQLRTFLPMAVSCGLDAMETMYAKYDPETTARAKALAKEYGILESGGSDFHGSAKPDIALGRGRGDLRIPLKVLELLKKKKNP